MGKAELTPEERNRVNQELRALISDKCIEIEDICRSYGLPMGRTTVITRDVDDDKMFIVTTNEPDQESLAKACAIATGPYAVSTTATEVITHGG